MEKLNRQEALTFLNKKREDNIAYINFIENNPVGDIYKCGESLLFRGVSDRNWVYIRSENQGELEELSAVLTDRDKDFALVQGWMLPLIAKGRYPVWQMVSVKLQLPLETPLPQSQTEPGRLKPEHAHYIYKIWPYAGVTTLDYTRDRIARGHSAAVSQDGVPVAWAITHDDGAIGFLYVREEFRGKGYAQEVTMAIARQLRLLNKPAFVHVEPDNEKSMSLARKLGFVERGQVMWVGY